MLTLIAQHLRNPGQEMPRIKERVMEFSVSDEGSHLLVFEDDGQAWPDATLVNSGGEDPEIITLQHDDGSTLELRAQPDGSWIKTGYPANSAPRFALFWDRRPRH